MNDQSLIFNKNRKFFEEFLSRTNQKKNTNDFLIRNFPLKHKKIKILSIGAGSGEDVIVFLKYLKSKNINFEFYYLDPSRPSFNLFKKMLKKSKLSKNLFGFKFDKFELFKTEEKFDIIIASHVFYYIDNWEKALLKLNKFLNKNGRGFILIQSKNSDNFKFRDKFLKEIFGKNYYEKSGDDLLNIIKKLSLNYKSQKKISILNITNTILKNNYTPQSGKKLLSFLLRTDYNNLDENIKLNINKYIHENSKIKNKKRIFELIDDYIIINK